MMIRAKYNVKGQPFGRQASNDRSTKEKAIKLIKKTPLSFRHQFEKKSEKYVEGGSQCDTLFIPMQHRLEETAFESQVTGLKYQFPDEYSRVRLSELDQALKDHPNFHILREIIDNDLKIVLSSKNKTLSSQGESNGGLAEFDGENNIVKVYVDIHAFDLDFCVQGIFHEIGHAFAKKIFGSTEPVDQQSYSDIQKGQDPNHSDNTDSTFSKFIPLLQKYQNDVKTVQKHTGVASIFRNVNSLEHALPLLSSKIGQDFLKTFPFGSELLEQNLEVLSLDNLEQLKEYANKICDDFEKINFLYKALDRALVPDYYTKEEKEDNKRRYKEALSEKMMVTEYGRSNSAEDFAEVFAFTLCLNGLKAKAVKDKNAILENGYNREMHNRLKTDNSKRFNVMKDFIAEFIEKKKEYEIAHVRENDVDSSQKPWMRAQFNRLFNKPQVA